MSQSHTAPASGNAWDRCGNRVRLDDRARTVNVLACRRYARENSSFAPLTFPRRMSSPPDALPLGPALVVDDDPAVRARLHGLLLSIGIGSNDLHFAGDVAAAKRSCGERDLRLAIVDVGLPDGSGLDLVDWIRNQHPAITPIVMSSFGSEETIVAAVRSGALGYLLKERDDDEVLASLRSIARGGAPIDPFVARHILRLMRQAPPSGPSEPAEASIDEALTARELEILGWVAQGLISREIAQRLERSPQTVECHIKNIFRKMSVSTRTEAVSKARLRGLLH
jgi:DNA-binding NarL/FixJ family response regulator